MKLAFISDTHFGDEMCTLLDHSTLGPGPKFDAFARAAGRKNDFLVMLGDIFDFSIAPYEAAYPCAKAFFQLVRRRGIAKNIVYVPGNHDFDMWHTVQQQIRVIYQVRRGRSAEQARWSLPGFIDDRTRTKSRGFQLPGVIGPVDPDRTPRTEKLFLNGITRDADGRGRETNFYVAYPNLYMVTDGHSLIVTHGHYLETFWTLSGELLKKVCDIRNADGLEDMVALNAPLCELACTGVGQAGKFTEIVHKVQRDVKDGDLTLVKQYLENLEGAVGDLTQVEGFDIKGRVIERISDAIAKHVKGRLIKELEKRDETRYSEKFAKDEDVLERFKRFYRASWMEIRRLNRDHGFGIEQPKQVIFGHTHRPIKWLDKDAPKTRVLGRKTVHLYNTGGWLWKQGKKEFCGAEVFKYETGKGFGSINIP
jgi:UDP-2,3-diacylglucosamine pyrophosphatase LpxH